MKTEIKLFWYVLAGKILILALFLFVFGTDRLIWSDSTTYIKIGRNIFAGRGVSDSPLDSAEAVPGTTRTLFYPVILGFFERFVPYGFAAVSLLQALAAAGIAILVYKIGLIFMDSKYALAAAIAASFEPLIASTQILIMPETFLILLLLLWMLFFIKHVTDGALRPLFVSIIFLALAVYVKPIAYYLFIVMAIILLVRHRSFAIPAAALLVLFLLFSPWMIYNKVRAGTFAMTTDDVGNLCSWELVALISTRHRIDSTDWAPIADMQEYKEMQKRCTSTSQALLLFVREYPKELAVASIVSAAGLLTNDGYSVFFEKPVEEQVKPHHNYLTPAVFINRDWPAKILAAAREMRPFELIAIIIGKIFWLSVVVSAAYGFWHWIVQRRSLQALFLLLFVLYIIGATVVSTGFGVGARLRLPIDPILLIFGAFGAQMFFSRKKHA